MKDGRKEFFTQINYYYQKSSKSQLGMKKRESEELSWEFAFSGGFNV